MSSSKEIFGTASTVTTETNAWTFFAVPAELRIIIYDALITSSTKREHGEYLLVSKRFGAEVFARLSRYTGIPPTIRVCNNMFEDLILAYNNGAYNDPEDERADWDWEDAITYAHFVERYKKVEVKLDGACVCFWGYGDAMGAENLELDERGRKIMEWVKDWVVWTLEDVLGSAEVGERPEAVENATKTEAKHAKDVMNEDGEDANDAVETQGKAAGVQVKVSWQKPYLAANSSEIIDHDGHSLSRAFTCPPDVVASMNWSVDEVGLFARILCAARARKYWKVIC